MGFFKNLFRKQRLPFITGSAAYGQHYRDPKTSDVDIVLLVSEETMEILRPFVSELSRVLISEYGGSITGGRIKAGDIDLILTTSEKDYDHWKRVTGVLKKEQPSSRKDAVNAFKKLDKDEVL